MPPIAGEEVTEKRVLKHIYTHRKDEGEGRVRSDYIQADYEPKTRMEKD